jgi:hypothetical protein
VQATLHTTRSSPPSLSSSTPLRPSSNQFALKTSFFSRSLNLLQQQQQSLVYGPPKFTMRVASKQAYICRDCGLISISFSFCYIWNNEMKSIYIILYASSSVHNIVAGIFTMRGPLLINCLINTSALVISFPFHSQNNICFYVFYAI